MSDNKVKFGIEQLHIAFLGASQTQSIEVTGAPGVDGDITLTITADTLLGTNSPISVIVPLSATAHNNATKAASAIVDVLNNNSIVNTVFNARHEGGKIYLWTKVAQDNDGTLNISFTDTDTTGATMGTSVEVTAGTTSWGTPKAVKGAVGFTTSPEGDTSDFYADNTKYYSHTSNNGYTGSLEVANIPDDILAEMLGMTVDSNGGLAESTKDQPKEFALMGQIQGDKKNRRFVYYRTKAARPGQESNTTEASVTPSTDSVELTMMQEEASGNNWTKYTLELSDSNATAYDSFFDAVPLPAVS